MSADKPPYSNPWDQFCFGVQAHKFMEMAHVVLYLYALGVIWGTDWSPYRATEAWLYSPAGLAERVGLAFPPSGLLVAVNLALTAAAVLSLMRVRHRLFASLFFVGFLLLDAWSNGFGFVNARIHFVWFLGALALCDFSRTERWTQSWSESTSLAFRFMELVTVLVYVQSGLAKLLESGWQWAADGTNLQIALLRQETTAGVWLAQYPAVCELMAYGALSLELLFLLYYPLPKLRRALLAAAIGFHIGTWIFMGISFIHLWIFSILAVAWSRDLFTNPVDRRAPERLGAEA
ncbi:hypothetical protein FIV42_10465 [Persicimonas caeni]|uniref:HTTM domain-containing protein n=1 Tax=Persicimonas caeni TaxID=2292766 RepID=A0A4Y6PSD6_PERCE|nr:hypothetical protein [Persicimonas caeni]QDG51143.1 hypothetical protein FIV42_10465 [Persicimonas caeni]QED32364.1 hypothetical protein FRD00_10460 [Persicimonas caeni]